MRENILRYILKATLSCIYYKYTIPWCEDLINYIYRKSGFVVASSYDQTYST